MEFFIGDKKYNYTEEQLTIQMLNHGLEADVYRIKDQAVKIYKKYCPKRRLDEKTVSFLETIDTKRLLLPQKTVYDKEHNFIGYTTKLIEEASKSTISRMKMNKMLWEMKAITEDTKLLTKAGVTVFDLRYTDVLYGDGIYYCDSGSYLREKDMTEKEIAFENKLQINEMFIEEIFGPCCKLTKREKEKLRDMTCSGDYLSDLFAYDDITPNESTLHFIKRITK